MSKEKEIKTAREFLDKNILSFDDAVNNKELRDLVLWCEENFFNGGALHIIIEDGNYSDGDILFCLNCIVSGEWSELCKKHGWNEDTKEHNKKALRVLELMKPLTEEKREMILEGKTITEDLFDILYNKALS